MLPFQENAVLGKNGLVETFKKLWRTGASHLDLTFKSPTGSGKTFMLSNFLRELQNCPEFDDDVAFVWVTFSDELAMQGREKFAGYFFPNVGRRLLTVADFSEGILQRDDVLFLNWQKLVSKRAADRVLRRPDDGERQKEQGFYFEDVVERTHAENREIVMIIDESHKNVTAAAYRDVIGPLHPRVLLNVSATPEKIPSASDVQNLRAGFVEVSREEVVSAGLIKECILSQTEEDLKSAAGEDLDLALLRLAKEKRESLEEQWGRLGQKIRPLVLIQLPDDDRKLKEQGVETKEEVVLRFLKDTSRVPERKIARWFAGEKENLDGISEPDSPVEFLLFKYAAGTGWDCPRAHIIVMFREIESPTFKTQTLGRILRNPAPGLDLGAFPELREGFLYTNYRKNEIADIPETVENRPKTEVAGLAAHLVRDFAVREAVYLVAEGIREKILPESPGAEKSVSEALPEIEGALKRTLESFQPESVGEGGVVAENPPAYDFWGESDAGDALCRIERLLESASGNLRTVIERRFGTVAANRATEWVTAASRNFAATLVEKLPASFTVDPLLKSDFISRADYGDIGKASVFQSFFVKAMNRYFQIGDDAFRNPCLQRGVLEKRGIDTNPHLMDEILVDATFAETNHFGKNAKYEMSDNEVEKLFMKACYALLAEQTEPDAKYGNVARSWGPFKEALRQWFERYALTDTDIVGRYKIFLKDLQKGPASGFRPAITRALKEYRPVRDKFVADRRKREREEALPFKIKTSYAYSGDYADYGPCRKSALQPFKLKKEYPGRENETAFIAFLEGLRSVEWWFKQNDEGKDFYAIKYFNTAEGRERLFYPDWIVRSVDGKIGIFDTKGGFTAKNPEGRAEALAARIAELNRLAGERRFFGGLCVRENGLWYCNRAEVYAYKDAMGNLAEGWEAMGEGLFTK